MDRGATGLTGILARSAAKGSQKRAPRRATLHFFVEGRPSKSRPTGFWTQRTASAAADCLQLQTVCNCRLPATADCRQLSTAGNCRLPTALRLLDLELDRLEDAGFFRQLRGARRELVRAEHERQDVGVLLPAERPGRILGHRDTNSFEQIADGQAVPARHELAARERRRHLAAGELGAMA